MCLFRYPGDRAYVDPRFTLRTRSRVCRECALRVLGAIGDHNVVDNLDREQFTNQLCFAGTSDDGDRAALADGKKEAT